MLKKLRISLAAICFAFLALTFLDFSGTVYPWLGLLAKMQFLPAVLALNLAVAGSIVLLTLLFGRVYCSVICPLGVFQDIVSWVASQRTKRRFTYRASQPWLRYMVAVTFFLSIIVGFGAAVVLLEPYSAFGRMTTSLFSPIYRSGNNLLAFFAEKLESFAFYSVDIWVYSGSALAVAMLTFAILVILAWKHGRLYCNTICPVGTFLGLIAKYSVFKPRINERNCTHCGLCAKNCKAECIDAKAGEIDYSRCVACFNCLESCPQSLIGFGTASTGRIREAVENAEDAGSEKPAENSESKAIDRAGESRRKFITISSLFAMTTAKKAFAKKFDGGFALIENKKQPERGTNIVPPGSLSIASFRKQCTGCLLCVSACPNQILLPSSELGSFMQPEMSFERGYCRPECTRCSEVCPSGAINRISAVEKSSIQIGHAVWKKDLCIVNRDKVSCNNCARHCPTGAITMIPQNPDDPASLKIPLIDEGRCIGCGACENLCPSRPFSAIYVEGHEQHKTI